MFIYNYIHKEVENMTFRNYDRKYGLLAIHHGFEKDDEFLINIVRGDVILDISKKHQVVGIELLNMSILEPFGITDTVLKNMDSMDFEVHEQSKGVVIELRIQAEKEYKAMIAMPLDEKEIPPQVI